MHAESKITRDQIAATHALIRPYVRRTPAMQVDLADFGGPARPIGLKLECLQHTGSFKARGAFANLLSREVPAAGVVAASGGNHGAAVAYAAHRLGHRATIFVPEVSSPAKIARILPDEVFGKLMDQSFGGTELAFNAVIAVAFETAIHDDAKQAPPGRNLNRFNPIDTQHKASLASVSCLRAFRRCR